MYSAIFLLAVTTIILGFNDMKIERKLLEMKQRIESRLPIQSISHSSGSFETFQNVLPELQTESALQYQGSHSRDCCLHGIKFHQVYLETHHGERSE